MIVSSTWLRPSHRSFFEGGVSRRVFTIEKHWNADCGRRIDRMNMQMRFRRIAGIPYVAQMLAHRHMSARANCDTSSSKMGKFNLHSIA